MIKINKLTRLSNAIRKLPGIGPKMADRLAFHILNMNSDEIKEIIDSITEVRSTLKLCKKCFIPSETELCEICSDKTRDSHIICVVEKVEDLFAIEKTKKYNGLYHILGGVISPIDGYGPDNIRIKELITRISNDSLQEIIIATNPTTEGDLTANYIADLLKNKNFKVTRIGYGLPVGGCLEYADEITLTHSIESRKEIIPKK
jgi:recombination protein RecR